MARSEALSATRHAQREASPPARGSRLPTARPFADDASGAEYFASDSHYRRITVKIVRHLTEARGFVLLTGDPQPDGRLVEHFLSSDNLRVTLLRCSSGEEIDELVRKFGTQLGIKPEEGEDGPWSVLSYLMQQARKGVANAIILDNVGALESRVLDEFLRLIRLDEAYMTPVVILCSSDFAKHFDEPPLSAHHPLVLATLPLQHLDREEVNEFVGMQLGALSEAEAELFSSDIIETIAHAANGNPVVINRLARSVLTAVRDDDRAAAPAAEAVVASLPLPHEAAVLAEAPAVEEAFAVEEAPAPGSPKAIPSMSEIAPLPEFLRSQRISHLEPLPLSADLRRTKRRLPTAVVIAGYLLAAILAATLLLYPFDLDVTHETAPQVSAFVPVPSFEPSPPPAVAADNPIVAEPQPPADSPPERDGSKAEAVPPVPAPPAAASDAISSPPETMAPAPPDLHPPAVVQEPPANPEPQSARTKEEAPSSPASDKTAGNAPSPAPPPQAQAQAQAAAPSGSFQSAAEIATMVRRGQQLLAAGDILSARHFFEVVVSTGNADAALGLGKTYDPFYLTDLGARNIQGNPGKAAQWYRAASDAGSVEALARLERLRTAYPP